MTTGMDDTESSVRARRLASAIEPFAGQVYFSPECHQLYADLGFSGSPATLGGVAMPDGAAYFCSRGSILGQAPGELIASAFAVFNPAAVVPAVTTGWSITDAATIEQARTDGAIAQLTRVLGAGPPGVERLGTFSSGRASPFMSRASRFTPGSWPSRFQTSALGAAWRFADRLREYRGDAHTSAWTSAALMRWKSAYSRSCTGDCR